MSIFHEANLTKTPDKPENVTFVRQRPYADFRPVDFVQDKRLFETAEKQLDAYLSKLFEGELDDGNADALDAIICDTVRLALCGLADQHLIHQDRNRDLCIQLKSGRLPFEEQLRLLEDSLEALNAEYEDICARTKSHLWRDNK